MFSPRILVLPAPDGNDLQFFLRVAYFAKVFQSRLIRGKFFFSVQRRVMGGLLCRFPTNCFSLLPHSFVHLLHDQCPLILESRFSKHFCWKTSIRLGAALVDGHISLPNACIQWNLISSFKMWQVWFDFPCKISIQQTTQSLSHRKNRFRIPNGNEDESHLVFSKEEMSLSGDLIWAPIFSSQQNQSLSH